MPARLRGHILLLPLCSVLVFAQLLRSSTFLNTPLARTSDAGPLRPITELLVNNSAWVYFLRPHKVGSSTVADFLQKVSNCPRHCKHHSGRDCCLGASCRAAPDCAPTCSHSCRFIFGEHTDFSDLAQFSVFQSDVVFSFTWLRDPVARVNSEFNWVLHQLNHGKGHGWGCYVLRKNLTFTQFLGSAEYVDAYWNKQTRFLAGFGNHPRCLSSRNWTNVFPDESALLWTAKRHLRRLSFFGMTERMAESIQMLRYLISSESRSDYDLPLKKKLPSLSLGGETIQLVRQQNLLDQELYEYAAELFQERWAAFQQKSSTTRK